jgi:5-methylcytosine-specific restriction endonuclease McrA
MGITAMKRARSPHQPTGTWIRPKKRLAIYSRDSFRCLACGRSLRRAKPFDVTLDHVLPVSKGGTNDPDNLYTCCRSCNSSRQEKTLSRFAGRRASVIRAQLRRRINIKLAKAIVAAK